MTMKSVLFLLCVAAAAPASAQSTMTPISDLDSRLRIVDYDEGAVVRLLGCVGFQTTISLADGEHVENVGIGDSTAWQVASNKRGNLVFVKAISAHAFSNMTIVTDKRSYNFELKSAPDSDCAHGRVTYELRFRYAVEQPKGTVTNPAKAVPDPNAFLPPQEKRNNAYSFSGSPDLIPMRVFDDGISTYFKWSVSAPTPAVYALNADNSESIVNYASRGDYLVVEQVAPAYVLRRGNLKSTLYNDAYKVEGLDAQSPRPRKQGAK